ncbi:MAG TPA: rhomboid family intramembrane serine protease [Pyrinomonadaceae bacterium]|nr:rhomboid family intramembrane serine protease [Pyrinomonadaceae bacterium]
MAEGESIGAGAPRTGVCRHCGALVGAGESRCMVCGTPVASASQAPAARRPQADPETLRFLRAVISRRATFTMIFIVANVFLYLLMWLSGGAQGGVLLAYGAKLNVLIQQGQWWRFVTPVFLHVQLPGMGPLVSHLHLLSNMYGLFMLGPYVEKLYGSARFVVFWVLTGVAGVAASYFAVRPEWADGTLGQFLFKPFDTPSAGASGALFGLMGVLFVFGIKYRHELPEGLKRVFGTGLLPTLAINLFIGYVGRRFIDNAAHLGGLLSGMALALVVGYKRPGARGAVAHAWHAAQVACLLLVAVSFLMVVRHFDAPPPRLSNIADSTKSPGGKNPVVPYIEAINAGQNALVAFLRGDDAALGPAAEKLGQAPAPSPDSEALRDDLKALVTRAQETAADKSLKPAERGRRMKQLDADFGAWQERFAQWVEHEGGNFDIGIQKDEKKPEEEKK